jgi:hypothetical protein
MRSYIPVALLAACGSGIGNAEFAVRATAGISSRDVANDLRALLDLGQNELSACGDRVRDRVRKGGPGIGDVEIVTYARGVASQTVQIQPLSVESKFGPVYNLCVMDMLRNTKVIASGYYDARVALHLVINPEKGPP